MSPVEQLVNVLRGGVALVVVLTVLVAVHELGHYLAARMYGMKVDAFAIFLGGLRKTDLGGHLARPLGPASPVWVTGFLGAAVFIGGSSMANLALAVAGLLVLGLAVPVWVATRLEKLYHLGPGDGLRRVGTGAAIVGFAVSFLTRASATGPDGVRAWFVTVLAAAALGAWFGVMSTYWAPTFSRVGEPTGDPARDEEMGHGAISVEGQPVAVRFRPVWSTKLKNGTELALNLLPLGGFVKIHGAHPHDDGGEIHVSGGQFSKGPFARFVVFAAGPVFSLALGVVLVWFSLMGQGKPQMSRVVQEVVPGTPAAAAKVQAGDEIMSIDGKPVADAIDAMFAIRATVGGTAEKPVANPVALDVRRGGQDLVVSVLPKISDNPERLFDREGNTIGSARVPQIGIRFKPTYVPVPAGEALKIAAAAPSETVAGILRIKSVSEARNNVGGIGTVAAVTASAAQSGLWPVVQIAGMLSISLGFMNLLPIMPLDGGQMLVAFVEIFRGGKRISPGLQNLVTNVGAMLIVMLVLTVLSVDVGRFTGGQPDAPAKAAGK